MNFRREPETRLPGWLWFFLILPLSLIVLLLYRRRQELVSRLPARVQQRLSQPVIQPRYTEPDSIPLEIHRGEAGFGETEHMEMEAEGPVDEEDVAGSAVAGSAAAGSASAATDTADFISESRSTELPGAPTVPGAAVAAGNEPTNMGEETGTPGPVPTDFTPTGGPDDLEIIEGIGPAIGGLLQDRGIHTFRQLADTPVERLQEILASARLSHLADPGTWAEQASLAAEGRWDDLRALQDTLKAGRRTKQE